MQIFLEESITWFAILRMQHYKLKANKSTQKILKVFEILNEDWSKIINIEIVEHTKILKHSWKKKEWPQLRKKSKSRRNGDTIYKGSILACVVKWIYWLTS